MNKEQQIEEMEKDINNTWFVKSNGDICGTNTKLNKNDIKMIAYQLVLEGYRKFPEDKVNEDFAVKHCYMKCDIAKTLVKEFAEKLKENSIEINSRDFGFMDFVGVDAIDELLKEYEK